MPFRHVGSGSLVVLVGLALSACRSEPPPANVTLPSATTASAPPSAPASTASTAPVATSLVLEAVLVPRPTAGGSVDAAAIELTLVNPTAAPVHGAWYRPAMYGLDVADAAGARVPVVIPPIDIPVAREELTLAPGERKTIPNAVTLWFDPSGKAKTSMFDWIVQAKRGALVLSIHLGVDLGDAGQVTLHATTRG